MQGLTDSGIQFVNKILEALRNYFERITVNGATYNSTQIAMSSS